MYRGTRHPLRYGPETGGSDSALAAIHRHYARETAEQSSTGAFDLLVVDPREPSSQPCVLSGIGEPSRGKEVSARSKVEFNGVGRAERYGFLSFVGGWTAHLGFSVFWALIFAFILSRPIVREQQLSVVTVLGLWLGYGAFLGLVVGGVLLPIGVDLAGLDMGFSVPFLPLAVRSELVFAPVLLVIAHIVSGGVLGVVYAVLSRSVPGVSL